LLIFQLAQGTAPYFAFCSFGFIMVAVATFNLAGGFSRTTGAYIFFFSTLAVIIGLCAKAVIGEAGDTNLVVPEKTISVYLVSILGMYCAVYVARMLTPRKAALQNLVTDKNLQNATVGCLATGIIIQAVLITVPKTSGSFLSALSQINRFLPMAMILGVIHQIRKSGGTSSINLPVILAGLNIFVVGVLGFSKEGMFTPLACWVAAISCQNYKLSRTQIAGIATVVALIFIFLVPYSQFGRNLVTQDDSLSVRVNTALYLLTHLDTVRQDYKETVVHTLEENRGYFDKDVGLFDRLQMISMDDALIDLTDRDGPHGLTPIIEEFENLVPHFFWPNKPNVAYGNVYAREIGGIIADEDNETGISFSPVGEGYHVAQWFGIIFVAPVLLTILFTLFDTLCGDTRLSPWGLLVIVYYSHVAPEGMLGGAIYAMGYVAFGLIVAALSAAYFMPIMGTLFKGPERTVVQRSGSIRAFSRRANVLPSSSAGE
jgi:hypothetical protein